MCQFDPRFCLPSKMIENPLIWMISVDGFIIDIRNAPGEIKHIAFEKGLIPFIPE
ncbi:MAG: hypothetical protein HEEMFOPI_01628 [Holosporales bacterium]